RGLQNEQAKLFYLYLLTCEHQSSAGCFRLPDAYAAADLAWSEIDLAAAREAGAEAGLIVHDRQTEEYFVPRWFKHNPGTNPKHRKGIERLISDLDSDHVREAAEAEFMESVPTENPLDTPMHSNGLASNRLATTAFMRGAR